MEGVGCLIRYWLLPGDGVRWQRPDSYMGVAVAAAIMSTRSRALSSQVLLGALIVLLGLLLLGRTTGLVDVGFLFQYVPALFVLLGIYSLVRSGFRNVFGPLVIVVGAAAWQLVTLDVVTWAEVWQFWPLFLVFFGLSLIASQWRGRPKTTTGASSISMSAIFGGSEQRSASEMFRDANLTAVFGGAELDLRDAAVADPPAHVNAVALFGGVSLLVPPDWTVELDVLPILGGASDERRAVAQRETADGAGDEGRPASREADKDEVDLVVSGFAAFGGVEVTD